MTNQGTAVAEIVARLRAQSNPANLPGMARYGIATDRALGVSMPGVRAIAREAVAPIRKDFDARHTLALGLWDTGIHEARILAALVDAPQRVDAAQMERWALDFDSWDVCDQVCSNLFDRTPHALQMIAGWTCREETFVKRAGFVLIAQLAVHAKNMPDEDFLAFFPLIEREAGDERNFVKKAVNWALRQVGKRSAYLRTQALECARRVEAQGSRSARWIAADASRELLAVSD